MSLLEKYPDLQCLANSSFYLAKFHAYPGNTKGILTPYMPDSSIRFSRTIREFQNTLGKRLSASYVGCAPTDAGHNFYLDLSLVDFTSSKTIKATFFQPVNELIKSGNHSLSPIYKEDVTSMIRSLEQQLLALADETEAVVYLDAVEDIPNKKFRTLKLSRICTEEISLCATHLSWLAYVFGVSTNILGVLSKKFAAGSTGTKITNPTQEQIQVAVKEYNSSISSPPWTDGWNSSFVTEEEFNQKRIEEMKEQVMKHCYLIPGFEIIDLRPVQHVYISDGRFELSLDAINHPDNPNKTEVYWEKGYRVNKSENYYTRPVIYAGESWRIYFKAVGKDPLRGQCVVYFATPEQYVEAYKESRPELVEDFKPWSDLIFISSSWCERNGSADKDAGKGINLQTPHLKRIALWQWIVGPMISNCISNGYPIQIGHTVNGYTDKLRVQKVAALLSSKGF